MSLSQRRAASVRRLSNRRQRERDRLFLVEGPRAVREALSANARVRFSVVDRDAMHVGELRAVEEAVRIAGIEVELVEAREFRALSSTEAPQGILLVCEQDEADLEQLAAGEGRLLVLDALQDPGNVGTLVRSSVAFGFSGVIALDGTADPWGPKVVRASAGAVTRARMVRAGAAETLEALRVTSRTLLVASPGGPALTNGVGPKVALVVGNEGVGIRDEIRAAADSIVSIPMSGPIDSLNAGIAGSILMHDLIRK